MISDLTFAHLIYLYMVWNNDPISFFCRWMSSFPVGKCTVSALTDVKSTTVLVRFWFVCGEIFQKQGSLECDTYPSPVVHCPWRRYFCTSHTHLVFHQHLKSCPCTDNQILPGLVRSTISGVSAAMLEKSSGPARQSPHTKSHSMTVTGSRVAQTGELDRHPALKTDRWLTLWVTILSTPFVIFQRGTLRILSALSFGVL